MGQITSLFVWKVVGEVDESVDEDALLRSAGIDPDGPMDRSHMVPDIEYYSFFERCAAADPKGWTLPLRVGAAMRCDEYGAFGLAWKSATNLRGSYERAERYARRRRPTTKPGSDGSPERPGLNRQTIEPNSRTP